MEHEFKKGTTTVGVLCSDGVVLGAEKRATMGYLIANKEVEKIIKIQDHMGLTIAGSVADAQMLGRLLKAECSLYEIQRGRKISIEGASTLLANILQHSKYFPYWVQILVGGYDAEPRLFSLDPIGSKLKEKMVSTGSGSPVAFGVLEDSYKPDRTIDENLPIVVRSIRAAMERDCASGNAIDIATISKGKFKLYPPDEVAKIK